MLLSHKHKFIFIHIYKTAGTSVRSEFAPYSRLIDRLAYHYWFSQVIFGRIINLMGWRDDGMKQFTGHHKHAKALDIEKKLNSKTFNSCFKFSFVRNPFDLTVSIYYYIIQHKKHPLHEKFSNMTFLEYVKWYVSTKPALQIDFLMSENRERRLVDYIGRFETLNKDVSIIKKKLSLEFSGLVEHKNPSKKRKTKSYKDYYDSESLNLIKDYFRPDFELLGYNFDGFEENIPLMYVSNHSIKREHKKQLQIHKY